MSPRLESSRVVMERIATSLSNSIAPQWGEFEEAVQSSAVQQFCVFASRYERLGGETQMLDAGLRFLDFNPTAESFTPQEAAVILEESYRRADVFSEGIVRSFCETQHKPVPEVEDVEANGKIILRALAGGIERVYSYMSRSTPDQGSSQSLVAAEQRAYLPVTLLMVGAHLKSGIFYDQVAKGVIEAGASEAEIDQAIDVSLQHACNRIKRNERLSVSKSAMLGERVFAASMNCLRTLYHQASSVGFQRSVMAHFYYAFKPNAEDFKRADGSYDMQGWSTAWFQGMASRLNPTLGANLIQPDAPTLHKSMLAAETAADKILDDQDEQYRSLGELLQKMYNTRAARHFVDAIAAGEIKYSEVLRAMLHLRQQPLGSYEISDSLDTLDEVGLRWQILPSGTMDSVGRRPFQEGQQGDNLTKPETQAGITLDWQRIARLISYAQGWGDALFARSRIPNLPEARQYYAVILPEYMPDGTLVEHAIADHPERGHGLYVWRGDRHILMDKDGKTRELTWREVFAHEKMIARKLGARCFYHTSNMEANVLNYLTAPVRRLSAGRHAIGASAVRMIQLGRVDAGGDR